jgi:hypothetical protein
MEEEEAEEGDKIIFAYHFHREPTRAHGVPFRAVCKPVCSPEIQPPDNIDLPICRMKRFRKRRSA